MREPPASPSHRIGKALGRRTSASESLSRVLQRRHRAAILRPQLHPDGTATASAPFQLGIAGVRIADRQRGFLLCNQRPGSLHLGGGRCLRLRRQAQQLLQGELFGSRQFAELLDHIGLADPQAQQVCLEGWQTYERLGSPEGELALAQAVVYLALAPKSNAVYTAYKAARAAARDTGSQPPPLHIRNAPTKLMKDIGYGAGYAYDHDAEDGFSGQDYFPEAMKRPIFYAPPERGFERELKKRIDYFSKLRGKRQGG